MLGRVYHTKAVTLTQGGAEYILNESKQLQFLYMFDAKAVTIGFKTANAAFAVISDSTEFNDAHTFGINFSYLYEF